MIRLNIKTAHCTYNTINYNNTTKNYDIFRRISRNIHNISFDYFYVFNKGIKVELNETKFNSLNSDTLVVVIKESKILNDCNRYNINIQNSNNEQYLSFLSYKITKTILIELNKLFIYSKMNLPILKQSQFLLQHLPFNNNNQFAIFLYKNKTKIIAEYICNIIGRTCNTYISPLLFIKYF